MSDMKNIGPVVRTLRKEKNMTLEELAHGANYDTGNLSKFERAKQGIEDATLGLIATTLGTTKAELLRKAADLEDQSERSLNPSLAQNPLQEFSSADNQSFAGLAKETRPTHAPLPQVVKGANKVPVFTEAHLVALADSPTAAHLLPTARHVPALPDSRPHDFAWDVSDDSMTSPPGEIASYPAGSIAYLDPTLQAKSGDAALISLGTAVAFTRIVSINGNWTMSPLNPRYPTRELPLNAKVLAVAIGCLSVFRSR